MYQEDEVVIYQSPGDGHCLIHSVIRSMRDQGLKARPTTDNYLTDMVIIEILNNLNFYGAFINTEEVEVDFIEQFERYESF